MRLKGGAIPRNRQTYFLNSVYLGNLRLRSKKVEKNKKQKIQKGVYL